MIFYWTVVDLIRKMMERTVLRGLSVFAIRRVVKREPKELLTNVQGRAEPVSR